MPAVQGILETSLYVEDLPRSAAFYETLFGFPRELEEERMIALNVADRQILLLFKRGASDGANFVPGGIIPAHDASGRTHLAFAIEPTALQTWREYLAAHNIPIESEVIGGNGGRSLYFRDPDGHLIELAVRGLWSIY